MPDPSGRAAPAPPRLATPYFSGGTGRSGTTVVADLLDRHPQLARSVPPEARFLTDRGGLCDLVQARSAKWPGSVLARRRTEDLQLLQRRLRGDWFRRPVAGGQDRGLHRGIDESTLESALAGFGARLRTDAADACARLTHELLDPPVRRQGKPRWMDTTPGNAARADVLVRIFPDLRLVHMVRDGRDVAASVARRHWGPTGLEEALTWWEQRMLLIGRALAAVPTGQVLTVALEDLVLRRREETLHRVLGFLGLEPVDVVIAHHEEHAPAGRGHVGRWEAGLDAGQREAFTARYEDALQRLLTAGAPVP